ncbi:MAG TPA: apolipoprotein N-acyltransferase [Methyloceanibacter sp.]|nr:apolipoprotein N-acyltransferase [Methyloceanibacter sp.]
MSATGEPAGVEDRRGLLSFVDRIAGRIATLKGAKRALSAAFIGAVSVLAFAPAHAWPVLFFSFGALVWLLDGCHGAPLGDRLKCAGITGFWFGFGYFLAGLYWIAEAFLVEPWRHGWLIPLVMTALPAGMALFFAAAAVLAMLLWKPGAGRVFALAIAFGLAEFARGHVLTGLPWNLLGYAILSPLPLMQLASLFGVYALSLLAVILFAAPAAIFAPRGTGLAGGKGTAALALSLVVLLGGGYPWGERRLGAAPLDSTSVRLRIVQANVDQANKWRPENAAEIFTDYLDLTKSAGLDKIDVVIWPETAVPFFLDESQDALLAIGAALPAGTTLLVGSARVVEERDQHGALQAQRVYNSLLVVDDQGRVVDGYDKIHLVPFGEFLPFQDFLESLGFMQMTGVRGGFSEGKGARLVSIEGVPPARVLICYEIIFPDEIVTDGVRPGWLLNITNDAWFGSSAGPYQHFHQAQVRAIEQGLPVARAANTGISAVIDAYGRVLAEIGLGEKGIMDTDLPKAGPTTFYAKFGIVLEFGVLLLALVCWYAWRALIKSVPRKSGYDASMLDGVVERPYERRRRAIKQDSELTD